VVLRYENINSKDQKSKNKDLKEKWGSTNVHKKTNSKNRHIKQSKKNRNLASTRIFNNNIFNTTIL